MHYFRLTMSIHLLSPWTSLTGAAVAEEGSGILSVPMGGHKKALSKVKYRANYAVWPFCSNDFLSSCSAAAVLLLLVVALVRLCLTALPAPSGW